MPDTQWPERTRLLKQAAEKTGYGDRFRPLDLAVQFDTDWNYGLPNRHDRSHSKARVNAFGKQQGTCVHLGNCDIGCDVNARNTLDLNYLAGAEQSGAEIRPLHLVSRVAPVAGGFEVHYGEIAGDQLKPGLVTGKYVVLAAGSLGSTEILLRSRAGGSFPDMSARLGHGWSSNGDFLTPALHFSRDVDPTHGPTITAAIDLLDGRYKNAGIFIEDGGLPDVGRGFLHDLANDPATADPRKQRLIASLLPILGGGQFLQHVMPWFAQARDAADGRLSLDQDGRLRLAWDVAASEPTIEAVASLHRKLARETDGLALTPFTWVVGRDLVTPHPLGGCNMGASAATGVVNHAGQVFGYPDLYVADGSIVPKAIGLNPSKTIAALGEYIARGLVARL